MFYECSNLESLPDISKWDTTDVTDMSNLFYRCAKLESIPDISKWNTSKVINMNRIFYECSSLKSFQIYQNGILKTSWILDSCFLDARI